MMAGPYVYVVSSMDSKLWLEHGPLDTVPPPRDLVDYHVSSVFAVDNEHVFYINKSNILLYQSYPWKPPMNENDPTNALEVAANVASVRALDSSTIYFMDTSDTLWFQQASLGMPQPQQVYTNVGMYYPLDANTVFVTDQDANYQVHLWLLTGRWSNPATVQKEPIDTAGEIWTIVSPIDTNTVYVVHSDDSSLWLLKRPWGSGNATKIERNIQIENQAIQAWSDTGVYLLSADRTLWIEESPWGSTHSVNLASEVDAYQAINLVSRRPGDLVIQRGHDIYYGNYGGKTPHPMDGNVSSFQVVS